MSEQWVRDRINALDGAEIQIEEALDDGDVEFVINRLIQWKCFTSIMLERSYRFCRWDH